jgi:sterol desaturase/sphingolipid hydroxylase (fatty acid hydroxylase superfamily)
MNTFAHFFATMSSGQKLGWAFACLTTFWLLEGAVPLVRFNYRKVKHARVNLFFLTTSMLINGLFTAAMAGVYVWTEARGLGLLHMVAWPTWVELLIAVLALDFVAQWFAHYLLHHVKWMWRLHLVHHSDTHVDATTGTRHHPLDYVIRELFSAATVLVFGIPLAFYVFYRVVTIFFTYFTHANINVPAWIDRPLSWVFVTPNMHKFHHHVELPWTDTNFGNVFSFWDRLMGTMVQGDPLQVRYGVDTLEGTPDESIVYQLKVPMHGRRM